MRRRDAAQPASIRRVQVPIAIKMAALITAILMVGMAILATVVIAGLSRLLNKT